MNGKINLKNLMINVLFPINTNKIKYCHIEYPYKEQNINLEEIYGKYRLYADVKIPITYNEIVDMKLKFLKNGIVKYTMQYRNPNIELKIRTDDAHCFPHMDVERRGESQEKIKLNSELEDYESCINAILRYVEKHDNPLIGPRYWLMPGLLSGIDSNILSLFNLYNLGYQVKTAYTDIARFVCLDIIKETSLGKTLNYNDYQNLINNHFCECKIKENENGDVPLESTGIQGIDGISILPFPIIIPSNSNYKISYLTEDYAISDTNDIIPTGFVIEFR
jgi:hypothetical protein